MCPLLIIIATPLLFFVHRSVVSAQAKLKKVNKQCLLDTTRTVWESEKLAFCQVIVQTSRPCFENKISVEFVQMFLKHAISNISQKYSHPKALYNKAYIGKKQFKFSQMSFNRKLFFETNSFIHMFNVSTLYRQHIKLLHQKVW